MQRLERREHRRELVALLLTERGLVHDQQLRSRALRSGKERIAVRQLSELLVLRSLES